MNGIEIRQVDELKEREVAIDRLISSEGWKSFAATMVLAKQAAEKAMHSAATGHDLAKHFGAHFALSHVLSWPEREQAQLRMQIEGFYARAKHKP